MTYGWLIMTWDIYQVTLLTDRSKSWHPSLKLTPGLDPRISLYMQWVVGIPVLQILYTNTDGMLVTLPLTMTNIPPFLAHLSRRLLRWAYSIPMSGVRPSVVVRRRPHFQTWISLKSVGQSWSNYMCSITGMGERLHQVLGQIGFKLWFPWQQKAPIDL